MFEDVPAELRAFNQWVCWRLEETNGGKPTKIPYDPKTGQLASVTDPRTWVTFEQAVSAFGSGWYSGIGFVLTEADPFCCIDLDDTQGDNEAFARQQNVFKEFESFAEYSPSGKGLHIWIKAKLPSGRRRSFIEIYSSARYMTVTGKVYRSGNIEDRQDVAQVLYDQMGGGPNTNIYNGDTPETASDKDIIERALNAANGEKFASLLNGEWQSLYPSQSEADFAFVDIISFYTQNRDQIRRIFRSSPLGKRDKAKRNDYVDYMVNKSFDRMLPPIDIDGLRNQVEAINAARIAAQAAAPVSDVSACSMQNNIDIPNYDAPPGLMGEIARFIYNAAPRPVPEIALAGSIGLMAGICGRSYNISGTGLNQYVLLLAPTGTGKEAIYSGIDKLVRAVQSNLGPVISDFIGPAEIASPQALIKYMVKTPSFVSMAGEFGLLLKQMSAYNAPPNLIGLRRIMLDLYNKSGEGKVLRPMIYSDKDKNTEPILSPAFTLLGESTPEKFYETLNEGMISEGLLPRFTIIEYRGKRPPLNHEHINVFPSYVLIQGLKELANSAANNNKANVVNHVRLDAQAKKLMTEYDVFCDDQINASEKDIVKQLWNRAHIKALKLSALIAIGINYFEPIIDTCSASWALNMVTNDVKNMLARFEAGEIGSDFEETKQISEVCRIFKEYVVSEWRYIERYKSTTAKLHDDKLVTLAYVSKRLRQNAAFRKDRFGATKAILRAIDSLKRQGDIRELPPSQAATKYNYSGQAYAIVNLSTFNL